MNKGWLTAALSAVLALTMIIGLCAPAAAAALKDIKDDLDGNGDGRIDYVAMGSSAALGEGVLPEEAYPELVKAAIAATGKSVSLTTLACPGMRAEDMRYILDVSYKGDAYTAERFLGEGGIFAELGDIASLRREYTEAISRAELITLEFGLDSFLTYALGYAFGAEYEADFTIFDEGLRKSTEEIKGRFEEVLNGYVNEGDSPETAALLQRVIDGVAYALVSHADSFDALIESIFRLNPGVVITVANIRNPLEGLEGAISGIDFAIPLSLVYGIIVDVANIYMAGLSAYDGAFNFAYVGEGETETLASDRFEDNTALMALIGKYAEEGAGADALIGIINSAISLTQIDLTAAAESKTDVDALIEAVLSEAGTEGFRLEENDDFIALTSDAGAMARLAVAVRVGYGQLPVLPNASGHRTIADAFISATAGSVKGRDVIAEDMNEAYSMVLSMLNRDSLLDLEYTFSPHYVLDPRSSYYVALGDGSAADRYNGYVTQIAKEYGLYGNNPSSHKYTNLAKTGLTPADYLDPQSDSCLNKYMTELKNADLITISFNNSAPIKYMFDQFLAVLKGETAAEHDWGSLLLGVGVMTPNIDEEIDGILAMMKEEIVKITGDEKNAEMLAVAIESYAYSYISRLVNYPMLINRIHEINKRAMVIIVGAYNDMENVKFNIDGEEFPIGKYMGYLVDAANLETLVFSALTDKTAYIACPDIDTKLGRLEIDINLSNMSIGNVLALAGKLAPLLDFESYNPTNAGHSAIARAVIDNLTIIEGPHSCNSSTDFDSACDNRCNVCMTKRNTNGHVFSKVCTEVCEVDGCNARNNRPAFHNYDGLCDAVCNDCKKTRDAAEHTYSGICDSSCDVCGEAREASGEHSFGGWAEEGAERKRVCSVCGFTESERLPEEDNTAVIVAAAAVAVAALGGGGCAGYFLVIKKKQGVKKPEQ